MALIIELAKVFVESKNVNASVEKKVNSTTQAESKMNCNISYVSLLALRMMRMLNMGGIS